jgi:DNA-binding HxlR family transcriptional regulator
MKASPSIRGHRQWTPLARALSAVGDRWTLLIVLALSRETLRLSVLRSRLPGVSSGVLDHHLGQMTSLGLISRRRFREMPPRVEVSLTEAGLELLPIAAALARWGMRHEWPAPPSDEYVRADAVLRQLPALLGELDDLPAGSVETIVAVGEERTVLRFEVAGGRLQAAEGNGKAPTAQIEGDEQAWIAALGPRRDYSGLNLGGRRRLAKRIFDSLPRDGSTRDSRLDGGGPVEQGADSSHGRARRDGAG